MRMEINDETEKHNFGLKHCKWMMGVNQNNLCLIDKVC